MRVEGWLVIVGERVIDRASKCESVARALRVKRKRRDSSDDLFFFSLFFPRPRSFTFFLKVCFLVPSVLEDCCGKVRQQDVLRGSARVYIMKARKGVIK
jgi:hypothetical protein